ncbi:MAG: MoxR family ATPase [Chitinivibrionales bacterium]|nr:MoxR family ATPase [Chitinivibrionales bacterium]
MIENNTFIQEMTGRIKEEIQKVIIGQQHVVDKCLIVIFTGNHALIEGVPGIAKTLLVRTLSHILNVGFNRIQFTPDLMPADITGTNMFNFQHNAFTLVPGPVFTSFLLADEINRAPAKTQSALLQAMQERKVTIDGKTHLLPTEFTVFATQNPIEYEGTYPLPEAQKDRFMLKIDMDYPDLEHEQHLAKQMLGTQTPQNILDSGMVKPVLDSQLLLQLRTHLESVTITDALVNYGVSIVRSTRAEESIMVGAGPRGTQALILASRAYAAIQGRTYVTPDDIKELAVCTLEHRILIRPEFELEGMNAKEAIGQVLKKIEVPR